MLLLRRRRSAPKKVVKPAETKSDCDSKCCKTKCEKPKKPTPQVVTNEEEEDVFEIQGITLRDPETNRTFKLKANAAVRDAFGCVCREEEETSKSLIPDHVLAMALQNAK